MKAAGLAALGALCSTAGICLAGADGVLGGSLPARPAYADRFFAHPERVLVRFAAGTSREEQAAALKAVGSTEVIYRYELVEGLVCAKVAWATSYDAAAKLATDPRVAYASTDSVGSVLSQVTPYGVPLIGAPSIWGASPATGANRGGGVILGVLDSGVDANHPDLPAVLFRTNFVAGTDDQDHLGHGTHCAGIAAARDNTIGVVGVAPRADLLSAKVCSDDGSFCATSDAAAAIDWAVMHGASVITMSFSVDDTVTQALEDICNAATAANVLLVAAAGNSGDATLFYPGSYASVVCVAAVNDARERAGFSTFGPQVDLAAPGVGVLSTYLSDSTSSVATAAWGGAERYALPLGGTANGTVAAPVISCGLGLSAAEFPAGVAGKIAHIRRGGGTFNAKANNAAAAGAIGVIISNNGPGNFSGTLGGGAPGIPVVAVSQADGDLLAGTPGVAGSVSVSPITGYTYLQGTSMATPHVAGAATALFSVRGPARTPVSVVRAALENTATDLGDPGRDDFYGHGLVNLVAAKAYLEAALPACAADFNSDGFVDPDDLSDYIACYFGIPACPRADFNGDGHADPDDLSDYIALFFGGC